MKKTISVNLNRQIFYLDIDAYDELEKYLNSIKKYFKDQNSLEVVDDIEARIAEKFEEIINKSKKAIQIADVEKIIEEMGTVDDITQEEPEIENEPEKIKKKLFRDPETKILAGVVAGLSQYFGIKPIWMRIILLVLLFNPRTFWLAIVGYIASWLIIPEAKTSWEKLEMKGKPTTVNELQTANEEKAHNVISRVEAVSRNIIQKIFSFFFRLIKFFGVWFCRLTGFFGLIFTILTIMAVMIGMIFVYLYPNLPYFDLSFLQNIGTPWLEIAYIAFGLIIITPFVFIIDLADSLMRLKWRISTQKIIILLAVWAFSLITFCGVAKINYPKYQSKLYEFVDHLRYFNSIDESNSQKLKITNPKNIEISNVREVKITQSDENAMIITGNQHQIQELEIKNSSDLLSIIGKNEVWLKCQNCTGYVSSVRVEIKTKNIESIKLNNVDAEIYPLSGNLIIDLVQKTGLKVTGVLDNLKLTAGPSSVVNLFDAKINRLDTSLQQATLKSGANVINITGDDQSRLIYKNNSKIFTSTEDKTVKQKYNLSRDNSSKLDELIEQASVSFDHQSQVIKNLSSSRFLYQLVDDYSNIYLVAKPVTDKPDVYVFWLTEKDEKISQVSYLKLTNWDNYNGFDFVNDNLLDITGQLYGPEMTDVSQQIFINKVSHKLELYTSNSAIN